MGLRETALFWGLPSRKDIVVVAAWPGCPRAPRPCRSPILILPGKPGQGTGGTGSPCTPRSPAWGLALVGQFTLSSPGTSLPFLQLDGRPKNFPGATFLCKPETGRAGRATALDGVGWGATCWGGMS